MRKVTPEEETWVRALLKGEIVVLPMTFKYVCSDETADEPIEEYHFSGKFLA
jgi:hypothetical protein